MSGHRRLGINIVDGVFASHTSVMLCRCPILGALVFYIKNSYPTRGPTQYFIFKEPYMNYNKFGMKAACNSDHMQSPAAG